MDGHTSLLLCLFVQILSCDRFGNVRREDFRWVFSAPQVLLCFGDRNLVIILHEGTFGGTDSGSYSPSRS